MGESPTIGLAIPLLFLVTLELSSVARVIDLEEVVEEGHTPILYSFDWFPQMGRFSFIHLTNTAIVGTGFYWVLYLPSENFDLKAAFGTLVFLIWVLLPIIEVDEYDTVLSEGVRPKSLLIHTMGVGISTALLIIATAFKSFVLILFGSLVIFLSWHIFLVNLEGELRESVES